MNTTMNSRDNFQTQYRDCLTAGGFLFPADRGLIEVTGGDRAAWLHNLVTNAVKTLSPGEGNYAFATNVKGRTLFDLNVLVLEDRLWLDIDRRWIGKALTHLDRYHITEDVALTDLSGNSFRVLIIGPSADVLARTAGASHMAAMAWLQHTSLDLEGRQARAVRRDLGGLPAVEIIWCGAMEPTASLLRKRAVEAGLVELDPTALDVIRIENGMPASLEDIDEEIIPPETGQVERGISYQKGCYLGQEVIERMRARGVLARRLVGVQFEGDQPVAPGTPLFEQAVPATHDAEPSAGLQADRPIGTTRSGCFSFALGAPLSLAYVKSASARPGTRLFAKPVARVASEPDARLAVPLKYSAAPEARSAVEPDARIAEADTSLAAEPAPGASAGEIVRAGVVVALPLAKMGSAG